MPVNACERCEARMGAYRWCPDCGHGSPAAKALDAEVEELQAERARLKNEIGTARVKLDGVSTRLKTMCQYIARQIDEMPGSDHGVLVLAHKDLEEILEEMRRIG